MTRKYMGERISCKVKEWKWLTLSDTWYNHLLTLNVNETFLFFLMRFLMSVARNWTQKDDLPNSRSIFKVNSANPLSQLRTYDNVLIYKENTTSPLTAVSSKRICDSIDAWLCLSGIGRIAHAHEVRRGKKVRVNISYLINLGANNNTCKCPTENLWMSK